MVESTNVGTEYWREISKRFQEPFDPQEVDFRVQGKVNEQTGRGQVVAYIDARAVQDRLDAVVGAGNWSFDWHPLVIDNGEVMIAKGTLTINGVAKSDAGTASNFEQSLGAVSHCFKRAAVHWGIGRYLYNLPSAWVQVEKGGRIPEQVLRDLRAKLPRPNGRSQDNSRPRPETTIVREQAISKPTLAAQHELQVAHPTASEQSSEPIATEKQLASIRKLCDALGKPGPEGVDLTYSRAREMLTQLSGEYQRLRRAS